MKSERRVGVGWAARSLATFESMTGPSRGNGKPFSPVTRAGLHTSAGHTTPRGFIPVQPVAREGDHDRANRSAEARNLSVLRSRRCGAVRLRIGSGRHGPEDRSHAAGIQGPDPECPCEHPSPAVEGWMPPEGRREGHCVPLRHPWVRGDERSLPDRVRSRLPGSFDNRGPPGTSRVPRGDRGHRLPTAGNLRTTHDSMHLLNEVTHPGPMARARPILYRDAALADMAGPSLPKVVSVLVADHR